MNNKTFDPAEEVHQLKAQTQMIRKRTYRPRVSKLDKYQGELLSMHREGASGAELQRWLRKKRMKVALSTVLRYLEKHG